MDDKNIRVKELRKELNLTQEEFGKMIGLSKSGVSNIEQGIRNVTEKHIRLISTTFNISAHWLQTGVNEDDLSKEVREIESLEKYLNTLGYFLEISTYGDEGERVSITIFGNGMEKEISSNTFEKMKKNIDEFIKYEIWKN